jgi:uncharacterized protein
MAPMTAVPSPVREPAWPLSRSAIGLWVTQGVLESLLAAAGATAFLIFVPSTAGGPVPALRWIVPIAVVIEAVLLIGVRPWLRFRVHRWEVTADAVYTQAGWFNQERRVAPMSRIQTVDSSRGPFEQVFGLADVTVTTASAAGPLKIHGLDHETAQRLADRLTAGTGADLSDAT